MNDESQHNSIVLIAIIARMAAAILCIVGAVYLMEQGKDGWGWLLFVAVLACSFDLKYNKSGSKEN